jgi:hypothetical protein
MYSYGDDLMLIWDNSMKEVSDELCPRLDFLLGNKSAIKSQASWNIEEYNDVTAMRLREGSFETNAILDELGTPTMGQKGEGQCRDPIVSLLKFAR